MTRHHPDSRTARDSHFAPLAGSVTGGQRNTRIELQAELAGHQGVGQGLRVRSCILDYPGLILKNGGRAQTWLPVDVADFKPMVR